MSRVIGIDLGTTNSVITYFDGTRPVIIPHPMGGRLIPSVVTFGDEGPQVGPPAREHQVTKPLETVYSIKRFMGRRYKQVVNEARMVPYDIIGEGNEFVRIGVAGQVYTPQEITAIILKELKAIAEAHLGQQVDRAVITVPAYFDGCQRKATVEAGQLAGLDVARVINEPTAAALACGFEQQKQQRIVVFDLGGGTFDLSAMEIGDGSFRVLGVHGNTHLGGDDFDQRIIDIVAEDYRRRHQLDVRQSALSLQRLKRAAEKAKHELSSDDQAIIELPYISLDGDGPKHLEYTLTRSRFESICTDLFDNIGRSCELLLHDTGLKPYHINDVVMVGGATRLPRARQVAREIFQRPSINTSIDPDEVVGLGAAVLAGVIEGTLQNVALMDVTAHSLGVETAAGGVQVLVPKNTPIPTSVSHVFTTPRDNQRSVPITVLEGESMRAAENRPLGLFRLTRIRKAPRGVPRIGVEFGLDADGILKVTATDQATGRSQDIVITDGCGLDESEIAEMKQPVAETPPEPERKPVELVDHANAVHQHMTEWLRLHHDMMPLRAIDQVEKALRKLDKVLEKPNDASLRTCLKRLDAVMEPYRKAG